MHLAIAMYTLQVEEFCKCVYVRHLKSLKDGLLIIWGWTDSSDDDCVQNDQQQPHLQSPTSVKMSVCKPWKQALLISSV